MFQESVQEIFNTYNYYTYVVGRRKEDLRNDMIDSFYPKNHDDCVFIERFLSEFKNHKFRKDILEENKMFFKSLDFMYENNLSPYQFKELLNENNRKMYKEEVNGMKRIIFASEFNKKFDEFWDKKVKEDELRQAANLLVKEN